jgi:hypothetical protein
MKFILLYIAMAGTGTPAQLGTYANEQACNNAIRVIFEQKVSPTDPKNPRIQNAIKTALQYQREYVCVPKE